MDPEKSDRPKAIPLQVDAEHEVYIEVADELEIVSQPESGGTIAGGDAAKRTLEQLGEVGETIAEVCRTVQTRMLVTVGASRPAEMTLEFALKLAGEAGVPFVSKGSAEGTFKVTAKWQFEKDNKDK